MKQPQTYNIEEKNERFFANIASEIIFGKEKKTLNKLFGEIPLNSNVYKERHRDIDYNFYSNVFKVILHNGAVLKSEKFFEKLVAKLYFYDDWQDLFKQEILKEIEEIFKENKGKRSNRYETLNLDFLNALNNEKKYSVKEAYPKELSFYNLIIDKNKYTEKRFIDFIDEVISSHSIYRYVDYKFGHLTSGKYESFNDIMTELCSSLYAKRNVEDENLPLYENTLLKELNLKCWLVFSDAVGYSFFNKELYSQTIIGYEFLIKILSKFYNILFLKTTLRNGILDMSKFEKPLGLLDVYAFEDDEYKKYKSHINTKTKNTHGFNFTRKFEDLENLYQLLVGGKFIKQVSFDKFSQCFQGEKLQERGMLEWLGSTALLAYFINALRDNDYISVSENLWQKTEYCFKNRSSSVLKTALNKRSNPRGSEEIDFLFKQLTTTYR